MEEENRKLRMMAVERFKTGESPESICVSLGKSRGWLYKWVGHYLNNNDSWNEDNSRRRYSSAKCTSAKIEKIEIVKMGCLKLCNQDLFQEPKRSTGRWKTLGSTLCAVHPHH
jgi:hypothetical protein